MKKRCERINGATVARQKWVCRHENLSTHGWVCGTQKKKTLVYTAHVSNMKPLTKDNR